MKLAAAYILHHPRAGAGPHRGLHGLPTPPHSMLNPGAHGFSRSCTPSPPRRQQWFGLRRSEREHRLVQHHDRTGHAVRPLPAHGVRPSPWPARSPGRRRPRHRGHPAHREAALRRPAAGAILIITGLTYFPAPWPGPARRRTRVMTTRTEKSEDSCPHPPLAPHQDARRVTRSPESPCRRGLCSTPGSSVVAAGRLPQARPAGDGEVARDVRGPRGLRPDDGVLLPRSRRLVRLDHQRLAVADRALRQPRGGGRRGAGARRRPTHCARPRPTPSPAGCWRTAPKRPCPAPP